MLQRCIGGPPGPLAGFQELGRESDKEGGKGEVGRKQEGKRLGRECNVAQWNSLKIHWIILGSVDITQKHHFNGWCIFPVAPHIPVFCPLCVLKARLLRNSPCQSLSLCCNYPVTLQQHRSKKADVMKANISLRVQAVVDRSVLVLFIQILNNNEHCAIYLSTQIDWFYEHYTVHRHEHINI